jgi:hypothetical protein
MIGIGKTRADLDTGWIDNHCIVPVDARNDSRARFLTRRSLAEWKS